MAQAKKTTRKRKPAARRNPAKKKTASKKDEKPKPKSALRGLVAKTPKEIIKFIGGDDIVVHVSKRSLVKAKTRNAEASAAKELDADSDTDDL